MQRTRGVFVSLKGAILAFGLLALTGCLTAVGGGGGSNSNQITSISVSPATSSIDIGKTQQFTATATLANGQQQAVTSASWTSSATTVATVNGTGLATAVAGGKTTITASVQTNSGTVKGTATLTVNSATLLSITVTPLATTIGTGQTQQFTATGTYSDGSQKPVAATWTSSDTTVATISDLGLATGVGAGTTTITATLGAISGSTSLTVTAGTLVSIAVTPANPTIGTSQTQQFTATGTYSDGSQHVIASPTWTSSDATVATIDSTGLATGVAVGTTTITASSNGIKGSTTLTIKAVTLESIEVTPADPTIGTGLTQQFTATGTYSDGSQQVIPSPNWTSSDTTVATISSSGLATGIAIGTTTITASLAGVSGDTTLTVTGSHTYQGTQSPGDLWFLTVDSAGLTFSAVNSSASLNYAGTLAALPNGFYKTTLTASTDPNLPIGTTGYTVEVPGTAVLMSLGGSTDKPIVAITAGPCPTTASISTLTGSLIDIGKSTYDSTQSESYEKISSVLVSGSYKVTQQSFLLDGTQLNSGSLPDGTCTNSVINIPNVPQSEGGTANYTAITGPSNGMYVLDMGKNSITQAGEGGAIGSSTPLTGAPLSDAFAQNYFGFLFTRNSTPITNFVGFSPLSGTSINGGTYTNLDTDPFDSHGTSITIDLPATNTNGFLEGTLTDTNGAHTPFVAIITKSAGKYYLFGITTDTSNTTPYVVMLAQH